MTYRVKLFRGEEMVFMAESHDQSYVVNALSAYGRSTPAQASWLLDTPPSPIRTETVRRIKPGVYGRLEVRESRLSSKVVIGVTSEADNIAPFASAVSAPELRELARVALEIAEYLDAQ